jgi:2-iminobutanoate/2-iminopropanoate deaminase
MDDAVRSVVYMTDLSDFSVMNEVYAEYFTVDPPGRAAVEVTSLPVGAHVEIEIAAPVQS